jgi:hypothetical protein
VCQELAELSASYYKKALFLNLAQGRRIWRGVHRYLVLCRVGSYGSVLIED